MEEKENVLFRLPSGCTVELSEKVHNDFYSNFTDSQYFAFNNIINSGLYFPQIMQFICVIIFMFTSRNSFLELFLCNLFSGIFFTIVWYKLKMYKIPGINFISCFIGGNFFRFFLHIVLILILSVFIIEDFKIFIFCLLGGIVTQIIKSILFVRYTNVEYSDNAVKYISKWKYKS